MIITISGSVDFSPKMIEITQQLEDQGHAVNIPYITKLIREKEITYEEYIADKKECIQKLQANNKEYAQTDMIKRYSKLIQESDALLVLNLEKKGIQGYIGASTLIEMGFAHTNEVQIFLYNSPPQESDRMHYIDEITYMNPSIIDQDLSKIK